jgi:hypothetical protein
MNGGWQVSFVFLKASLIALLTIGVGLAHAHPHLRLAYQLDPMLNQARQLTGFLANARPDLVHRFYASHGSSARG